MPFGKDDKEAAIHMNSLVGHFASGKNADDLRYESEFGSLTDIKELSIESLTELSKLAQNQLETGNLESMPYIMSEASLHVEILDTVAAARAEQSKQKK